MSNRIAYIIGYFREEAECHRKTFTKEKPIGGHNAELFDKWADAIEQIQQENAQLRAFAERVASYYGSGCIEDSEDRPLGQMLADLGIK